MTKRIALKDNRERHYGPHVVIVPGHHAPSMIHDSFGAAKKEAERLTKLTGLSSVILPAVANGIVYGAGVPNRHDFPGRVNPEFNDAVTHRFLQRMNEAGMVSVV